MNCHRCKFDKPDVKPRFGTYGIYIEPREFIICDSCHETLVELQNEYNPKSRGE